MRLTNNQIFSRSMQDMSQTQKRLNTAHSQVTSQEKFRTSGDAPAEIAKSSYLNDEIKKNTQYQTNGLMLKGTLGLEETTLSNLHIAMERGRLLSVRALNGTVDSQDRFAISLEMEQLQKEVFSLANTKNANGDFIFSGTSSHLQTYVKDAQTGLYTYRGNEQDNEIQIATNVYVSDGDNGARVFESVPARLTADTSNLTGNITAAQVEVIEQGEYDNFHFNNYDHSNLANNTFKLSVTAPLIPGNSDKFEIRDTSNNLLQSGNYASEKGIRFNGVKITAVGAAPGSLDISLIPPKNINILNTLESLKIALADTSLSKDDFRERMADAQVGIENAQYAVMSTTSMIGGRNNTIERVTQSNESFKVINQEAMAILTEADLAAAMTDLTKEQNILEMSYKSFNKINNLSLFNSVS
ncbi:Putative flagellar synthesis; flagellar regulon; hook-associatedprotein [Moritella viscosa]|uniref:flagellar hook-associated protein FlgL n=1 Tax=Moritella viscosa TaxID=80854 RepID=UPI000910106A|nr:flagellar hook-associated protein FlgL [Moritella viscosa]SGY92160.1 Putative flagellar synthesis; flagellar regulon; hook-associatedprotein [Moritella viscosa]